jgi:hypothetical protein
MVVTAKVRCLHKTLSHDEKGDVHSAAVSIGPNYTDENGNLVNQAWASATPALSLTMTLNPVAAEHFKVGRTYELHLVPE